MPSDFFRTAVRGVAVVALLSVTTIVVGLNSVANAALPDTSAPQLVLNHTIRTTPFNGSTVSAKDDEGSAYVPSDNSLWLADDDGRSIYEVNAATGALKRSIGRAAFEAVPRLGGGASAGVNRDRDLESLAYDAATDTLYVFSGSCCNSTVLPTVFRLKRQGSSLQLDSYQPLPAGSDFTAAAWNPADGKLYVGVSKNVNSYTYASDTVGPTFQISGLSGILGMSFSADGSDMFVARSQTRLSRVDWATRTLVPGWTFDVSSFGMLDTRAVEVVNDQFWVSDGYDFRSAGDPLAHAVFVLDVVGPTSPPTASFAASRTSGQAPMAVDFTDTSTGGPTSWLWDFGDGQNSTTRNPSHTYTDPGTYTVTLTASNANGSSTASKVITAAEQPPPPPPPGGNLIANDGFETNTAGWDTAGYAAVTLQRVPGGHSGSWSAKLTNTGATSVTNTLNDEPDTVPVSSPGTYTGSVWVRSDTAGGKVYLRIREFEGKTKVGEQLIGVVLSTNWQQLTGSLVPLHPGVSSIDFSTAFYSAPAGSTFYADDASLTYN
jgi:PKD repeat protein